MCARVRESRLHCSHVAPRLGRIVILLILAIGAYLPALRLPFIEDDYGEIPLARTYAAAGWHPLWDNPHLRTRATSMFINAEIDDVWGFRPAPFYVVSIAVHAVCVLLLYLSFAWREVLDESTAFWAACFFAIYEGHQEAVMWISARSEAVLFLFGMAAWLAWVMFLRSRQPGWYCLSIVCFVLAAFSKESFIVFAALMVLPCIWRPAGNSRHAAITAILPFFGIAIGYLVWSRIAPSSIPNELDDRFTLSLAWPAVFLRSFWRLMFVWGLVAVAILLWTRVAPDRRKIAAAFVWILVGILPYSFLTYMPQIASRHTYVASAGLALLVGTAAARLAAMRHRAVLAVLCVAALSINLEILWVKKMAQFRERAEPSERLKQAGLAAVGPVDIDCTPYPDFLAADVLSSVGAKAEFRHPGTHQEHCFVIEYQNAAGEHVSVNGTVRADRHGTFR